MDIFRDLAVNSTDKKLGPFVASLLSFLPDSLEYQLRYLKRHGKLCNFTNPQSLTEKIHHRMRYPLADLSRLTDKVLVREYIQETVGDQYNVPLYAAVDVLTASQFDILPQAFVMKANNTSGTIRIVKDKGQEKISDLVALGNAWLRYDFSKCRGERHYKPITPQVLFEEALLTEGEPPADYKVHVFNPPHGDSYVFLQIIKNRFGNTTQNLYSADWLSPGFRFGNTLPASTDESVTRPPPNLVEMLDVAKRLSKPYGYCRVDMYLFEGRIYVGELTFTPGAGAFKLHPAEWDLKLGGLFRWPDAAVLSAERTGPNTSCYTVNELG